jgi:ATP-binding cassette, subfamily B, bacterial
MTRAPASARRGAAWNVLRSLRLVFRAAFHARPGTATLIVAATVLQALLPPALAWVLEQTVSDVQQGRHGALRDAATELGVIGAAWALTQWIALSGQTALEEHTDHWIERRLFDLTLTVPGLSAAESPEFQDRMYTVANRSRHMIGSISTAVGVIGLAVRLLGSIAVLIIVAPSFAALPLLTVLPVLAALKIERIEAAMLDAIAPSMRTARLLFQITTDPGSGEAIRLGAMAPWLADQQSLRLEEADRQQRRARVETVVVTAIGWVAFSAGVALLAWIGSVLRTSNSAGAVIVLVVLALQLVGQAEAAAGTVSQLSRLSTVFEKFFWLTDFADTKARGHGGSQPAPSSIQDGIALRDVTFRHHPDAPAVLDGINLVIPRGSTLALVGHNGAGKTTLVKILLGLYQVTDGEVLVDDIHLRSLHAEAWADATAAGFQDYCRFQLLAQESVGAGDLPRIDDLDAISLALRHAGASDLDATLPQGLRTPLGPTLPGGIQPSQGQWQKLAIARALMRGTPLLRVLDEPTSSLDAETERQLFDGYLATAQQAADATGSISILVSHRFATVRTADQIAVLDGGRISELGSHAELMAADGWYAKVCRLQASDYT